MTARSDKRPSTQIAADAEVAGLSARVVDEAAQLDSVDSEVTLLRLWLNETTGESERDHALMRKLFHQVVGAAAVRYKLSPKRTDDLASAVSAVLDQIGSQLAGPIEREV